MLDVLILFVTNFQDLLCKEEHPFMTKIIKILKHLLGSPYEIFICALYRAIAEFISKLKKCLFLFKTTTYCQDLTYEILHHCNSTSRPVRNRAGMTFYLLMKVHTRFLLFSDCSRQTLQRGSHYRVLPFSLFWPCPKSLDPISPRATTCYTIPWRQFASIMQMTAKCSLIKHSQRN